MTLNEVRKQEEELQNLIRDEDLKTECLRLATDIIKNDPSKYKDVTTLAKNMYKFIKNN